MVGLSLTRLIMVKDQILTSEAMGIRIERMWKDSSALEAGLHWLEETERSIG